MSSQPDLAKMSSTEMQKYFDDLLAQKKLVEKQAAEEPARREKERLEEERREKERKEQERKDQEQKEKEEKDRKRREEESRLREEQRKQDAAKKAAEDRVVTEKVGKSRRVVESEGESEAESTTESTPPPEGKGKQKGVAPMLNVVAERKRRADEFQQAQKDKMARILELRELWPENPGTKKQKTRDDDEEEKAPCNPCEVKGLDWVWSKNPRETSCEQCQDKKRCCVVDGCTARVERKRRKVEAEGPETPKSKPGPSRKKTVERFPVTGSSETAVLNRFSMVLPLFGIAESLRGIRKTQRGIRNILVEMAVVQEQQLLSFQNQMTVMSAVLEQFKREFRWWNDMLWERMELRMQDPENGAEAGSSQMADTRVETELVKVKIGHAEEGREAENEGEGATMREE